MSQTANRLITFETDEDERLVVLAGQDEMDKRTIYSGSTSGRYAIVPISELEYDRPDYATELDVADLEVLGDTATIEPGDSSTMTLLQEDELVVRGGDPGVYGLLRIPFERT